MKKKILVVGDSGMLGSVLISYFELSNFEVFGCSRNSKKKKLDITDHKKTINFLNKIKPEVIINCCAEVNIELCEKEINHALKVNALAVQNISTWCSINKKKLVQISTDQFFLKKKKNKENEKIFFFNHYGLTKFLGECFTKDSEDNLIIRTNIIGPGKNKESFVDWVIKSIKNNKEITLFDNYFTSSIDVYNFSELLLKLIKKNAKGIFNLASSEVFSKKQIIEEFSRQLGIPIKRKDQKTFFEVQRCLDCGLDTPKIEKILKLKMPKMEKVVASILKNYEL